MGCRAVWLLLLASLPAVAGQGTLASPISSGTGVCPWFFAGGSNSSYASPATCQLCLVAGSTLTAGAVAPGAQGTCNALGYPGGGCTGTNAVYLFSGNQTYNTSLAYYSQGGLLVRDAP